MASVADILPPEDKRRYSQTSPQAQKAFQNQERSRVSNSRIRESSSPASNRLPMQGGGGASPSKYRQLQENLRAMRLGVEGGARVAQSGRRYGQNRQIGAAPKPESKLGNITILLMLSTAVAIDLFQILLTLVGAGEWLVNDIMDIGLEILFYMWFKIKGIDFASTRKVVSFLGTWGLGMASDGIIPTWTLEISLMIFAIKAEEKLENASPLVKSAIEKGGKSHG